MQNIPNRGKFLPLTAPSAADLVELLLFSLTKGAGSTRFRSRGPWFDGLDFGPEVGRPRLVRLLQGGRWLDRPRLCARDMLISAV